MTSTPAPKASNGLPTILLVHGAFAESSSWNGVATWLLAEGYRVVALANPLRGVKSDAAGVTDFLATLEGPVVLMGYFYGGSVISAAGNGTANVAALVFVAAFAPDKGESAASLAARFPGSTLGAALAPYGTEDRNIPAAALASMAERASARRTVVVNGASHVVMVSHPQVVANLIDEAARSVAQRP